MIPKRVVIQQGLMITRLYHYKYLFLIFLWEEWSFLKKIMQGWNEQNLIYEKIDRKPSKTCIKTQIKFAAYILS